MWFLFYFRVHCNMMSGKEGSFFIICHLSSWLWKKTRTTKCTNLSMLIMFRFSWGIEEIGNFYEQIGKNTNYIIHPEEILADNFALLVMGQKVSSPWLLDKLKSFLMQSNPENEG